MSKVICENYKIGKCRLGWKCPDSHRWNNPIKLVQSQTNNATTQPISANNAVPTTTSYKKPKMSHKEVVTLNIGEAGINFGDTVWRQHNAEHGINQYGILQSKSDDNRFSTFYHETESGKYVPRTLMIDTDPNTINAIKHSNHHHSSFYDHQYFVSHKNDEDAANNFARGHYTVGKECIDDFNEALRHMVDNCDNFQGFILNYSVGGGTGSGLGALILERIAVDYRKKIRFGFPIYPFYENHHRSNCVIEPYNALLASHWLLDHTELSFIFDNAKIYDLCRQKLGIRSPSYNDMNLLMAKIETSISLPLRLEYEDTDMLSAYQERIYGKGPSLKGWVDLMVQFPRLHCMVPALAPLFNKNLNFINIPKAGNKGRLLIDGFVRMYHNSTCTYIMDSIQNFESPLYSDVMNLIYGNFANYKEIEEIVDDTLNTDYWMINIDPLYDPEEDQYTRIVLNSHGWTKAKLINGHMMQSRNNKKIAIVPALFFGWRNIMDSRPLVTLPDDTLDSTPTSIATFYNGMPIGRWFENTICKRYDYLYSQRAYVHWFVGEGMEEGELAEAREDLGFLLLDYEELPEKGTG